MGDGPGFGKTFMQMLPISLPESGVSSCRGDVRGECDLGGPDLGVATQGRCARGWCDAGDARGPEHRSWGRFYAAFAQKCPQPRPYMRRGAGQCSSGWRSGSSGGSASAGEASGSRARLRVAWLMVPHRPIGRPSTYSQVRVTPKAKKTIIRLVSASERACRLRITEQFHPQDDLEHVGRELPGDEDDHVDTGPDRDVAVPSQRDQQQAEHGECAGAAQGDGGRAD